MAYPARKGMVRLQADSGLVAVYVCIAEVQRTYIRGTRTKLQLGCPSQTYSFCSVIRIVKAGLVGGGGRSVTMTMPSCHFEQCNL